MKTFCPFIKEECTTSCMFNNAELEEGSHSSCLLYHASMSQLLRSTEDSHIDEYLQSISANLDAMSFDTSVISNNVYETKLNTDSIVRSLQD